MPNGWFRGDGQQFLAHKEELANTVVTGSFSASEWRVGVVDWLLETTAAGKFVR